MNYDSNIECCGSGCTNCVLDERFNKPITSKEGCDNVIKQNYTKFKLTKVEKCTSNVFELTFARNGKSDEEYKQCTLVIPGGSYLMLRAPKNVENSYVNPIFYNFHQKSLKVQKNENFQDKLTEKHDTSEEDLYISRPYTPVFVNEDTLEFTVFIKLEPFGRMSNYIMSLQVNDLTEWKGVYNDLPSSIRANFDNIMCFSHGVSIAPIYTISRALTEDDSFESNIHVNACFKDISSILLRDNLIQLNMYWNFKSTIILSRERHNESCKDTCDCINKCQKYGEKLYYGRIDEYFVLNSIKQLEGRTLVLICGSNAFTNEIRNFFQNQNLDKEIEIHIL